MATIAESFFKQSMIAKRQSDTLYNNILKDVKRLNKVFHRLAIESYGQLIDHLGTAQGTTVNNSMENLELLSLWIPSFDLLLNRYRVQFRNAYEANRINLYEVIKDKEFRLMKVLARMGIRDDRVTVNDNTLNLMNSIFENMYRNIEAMLNKWRNYVYDTFFQGITQSKSKEDIRSSFINDTGTLRIGSSLEETSELEASRAAIAAKTTFLREQAAINGYDYCWNVNPMDRRTKPICMEASLAGVISEDEMARVYGFPPRHICRCEIAYTRGEWTELNQGINEAVRGARLTLIDELIEAPRQLAEYFVAGRLVIPSDPVRASGNKMYADIEEKLATARANEVPDFELE